MFRDLDATLEQILNDPRAPLQLRNAAVSFETPDRNFAPGQPTINLFLYEVQENRVLRDPVPITEIVNGMSVRRMPPLRVDCCYLVSAWSNQQGAARIAEEHRLLAQALVWSSRFSTIPAIYLQGSLANQPFPPPTMIAQPEVDKKNGEFWSALGIFPRPVFHLAATIAMDLDLQVEGPMVTTAIVNYQQDAEPTTGQEWMTIGGEARNAAGNPVQGAWVRLEPDGLIRVTGADGRFVFDRVRRGNNYTLRARAVGLGEGTRVVDIPSVTGEYDLQIP